jgi:hypothetical protein
VKLSEFACRSSWSTFEGALLDLLSVFHFVFGLLKRLEGEELLSFTLCLQEGLLTEVLPYKVVGPLLV